MKNPTVTSPRFTCRLVRGCISIFGDTAAGEPRGPGAAHVTGCADCQQFFGACEELDLALKRDAAREWREAPTSLEQNIMRAVKLSVPESAPPETHLMRVALMTACAVAAVFVYQKWTLPAASTPTIREQLTASPVDPSLLATARQIIASVPADLLGEMQPRAEELLRQDPLQNEVDAVVSDARTAVRFLARNFLPTPRDEAASGE